MTERDHPQDATTHIVEALRFHAGDTIPVDQLAAETDADWATVYNAVRLIETVQRLAPTMEITDAGVAVDSNLSEPSELYDSEMMTVLSYLFAHTRTVDPLVVTDHPILEANTDGIDAAEDAGFLTRDDGEVSLTPDGLSHIGPKYTRCLYADT